MTQECPLKSYYVCKVLYNVRTISSYLVKEFMQTALNEEIVAFSKSINDVLTKASSLITSYPVDPCASKDERKYPEPHLQYRPKEAIIFKTAKQEVTNFYRRNKLSFSDFKEEPHLSIVKDEYDEDEFRSYSEQVQKLLKLIPEKSKSFFLKHKIDGLSYSEIAKESSISKNAVAKHVNKVLNILKTNIHLFFFILIFIKKLL